MESTVNVPLLRKGIEWAEAEDRARTDTKPSQWDQTSWVGGAPIDELSYDEMVSSVKLTEMECGTTCCIAGWIGFLTLRPGEYINGVGTIFNENNVRVEHCSDRAQRELGLDNQQAWDLFYRSHDIESVRTLAESIAGERL